MISKVICKIILVLVVLFVYVNAFAETLYVNSSTGSDDNRATLEKPLKTIARAAEMVNKATEPGPTTIKIAPGTYCLTETVLFQNSRDYTRENRLTIEATVLPDEPDWKPSLMPIIISAVEGMGSTSEKHAIDIKIELNHVTIRGIKFLGNPRPRTCNYSIFRAGKKLQDLVITQCLFMADKDTMPYFCPICANGHGIVVEHSIFYHCCIPVIFWDAASGISKNNAMRYCIVDGAEIAAVWTCQTDETFAFHNNVITHSEYFWMRSPGNRTKYCIKDCVITDNRFYSGYGTALSLSGQTGSEVIFTEQNVIKKGEITLEKGQPPPDKLTMDLPRNYLHVQPGTLGSDLGAGLFKKIKPVEEGENKWKRDLSM